MMIKLLLGALLGCGVGALLAHFGKCSSGSYPLRGLLFGAALGVILAFLFAPTKQTAFEFEEEQPAPAEGVVYIGTPEVFEDIILQASLPCLVDFYSDSCPPCRRLSPVIDALAEKYAGRAIISKVNVASARELTAAYQVYGIPDVLFFQDGEQVERLGGLRPQAAYERIIDQQIENMKKK